jgi:hypothetical protein
LFGGNGINLSFSDNSWDLHEEKPRERGLISRFFHRRRHSHDKEHMFGHLEDRFIRIALRISLYPISLIIVNGIIAIGDLYISSQGGVKNSAVYGLYRLYYFLYGARGIVFAMLGLFVDPCLPRGLKQAWKVTFPRGNSSSSESFDLHLHPKPMTSSARAEGCLTPTATRVEQQEMILVNEVAGEAGGPLEVDPTTSAVGAALARQESAGSIDMLHALLMSGPPKDHGHWTHEWHSGAGADGELTEHEDKLRQERHGARAHSFPTFSVARFLRRGSRSRRASTADGKDANADVEKAPAELRIQPPIPEMSPPSTPMALSPRAPGSPGSSASPSSPTSPHVPHTPVLPYSPHSPHSLHSPYSPHSPRLPRSGASTPPAFTMTFAGVAADALPAGFDDHAHDVVHPEALEAAKVAAEKADAEAAAAAAAAASAPPRRPSLAASSTTGVTSAATTQVPSGPFNFAGLLSGFRSSPSPSATPPRRGSLASTGNTAGRRDSLADQGQGGTTPRESRASSRLGTAPRRAGPQPSGEMQLTPIEERRQRRERALEIAERLYEEMEAQL